MSQLDPHAALIYTMVIVSAADGDMDDSEMKAIGETVRRLPAFKGFDTVLTVIAEALPGRLRETAYAIACDIAAANLDVDEEEMTVLQQIRWRLDIDRLIAAAIERGSRARHQTV